MKKLIPVSLFFISVLAFSCGGNKPAPGSDSAKTVLADTVVPEDTLPKTLIADLLGGDTIEPKNAAEVFFRFNEKLTGDNEDIDKIKGLSAKEVRKRFWPIDTACDAEAAETLHRFFELDSIRRSGSTDFGQDGQTIFVLVRVKDTLEISPAFTSVLWTMDYHSHFACPFSQGTYYMLTTYDKNGTRISTQEMGQKAGGGDAPISWNQTENNNLFTDGSFKTLRIDTVDNGDEEGKGKYEITKKIYRGKIDKAGKIVRVEG